MGQRGEFKTTAKRQVKLCRQTFKDNNTATEKSPGLNLAQN